MHRFGKSRVFYLNQNYAKSRVFRETKFFRRYGSKKKHVWPTNLNNRIQNCDFQKLGK